MFRTFSLLMVVLMLAGCRSSGQTVNPFLGSNTVPAQPTGAIGPGANATPYYPPNVSPGQPSTVPAAGPYNYNNGQQQQWVPSGTGSINPATGQMQFAVNQNQPQPGTNGVYIDPNVRQASATNSVSISAPITYPASNEAAVQIPSDNSPLVTQRQALPPVVNVAVQPNAKASQPVASQYTPVTYDMSQGRVQTILPAQASVTPVTAIHSTQGQIRNPNAMTVPVQGMPANLVYNGTQTSTIVPQPTPTSVQVQPQYYGQPTVASGYVTTTSGPTLATGPTLASSTPTGIRNMPAVNFDELPRVQR